MLKHKYMHSILQQNKFKFRLLEAPSMDGNMVTKTWIP